MSGNAWKQYESPDFNLMQADRSGIQIAASGDAEFIVTHNNRIQLKLTGPEFKVEGDVAERIRPVV